MLYSRCRRRAIRLRGKPKMTSSVAEPQTTIATILPEGSAIGLMSRSLEAQAESLSSQIQMLAGVETLKASGTEHRAIEHWSNLFVDMLIVSLARGRLSAFVDSTL